MKAHGGLSAARMKMREVHTVPRSTQAARACDHCHLQTIQLRFDLNGFARPRRAWNMQRIRTRAACTRQARSQPGQPRHTHGASPNDARSDD